MNHLGKRRLLRLPFSQWLYDFTDPDPVSPTASIEDTPLRNSIQ
ncbi:hypothetical protein [Ensifer adhaerens]|nr:hypothetical protein [Ensifer adhaerens]